MTVSNVEDQPWEGGVSVPVFPPHVPLFDSAAVVVTKQTHAQAGVAVAYSRERSARYASAIFGAIAEQAPGQLAGTAPRVTPRGGWRRGGRASR